jgi:hypothetical protein
MQVVISAFKAGLLFGFFVWGMLSARAAIFIQTELFGVLLFVPPQHIITTFAFTAAHVNDFAHGRFPPFSLHYIIANARVEARDIQLPLAPSLKKEGEGGVTRRSPR